MNNSPTEGEQVQSAPVTGPTEQNEQVQQSAEQSNQETNSGVNTQGSVSDDTATQNQATGDESQTQTQQTGGESTTDEGLANFAKSQNIDLATASDDVKRLLKVALDNQKAARSNTPSKSISEATESLGDGSIQSEVNQLKYERTTDRFWSAEGRDKSLEPTMVQILNEKVAELTPMFGEDKAKEYAYTLSRDLDTLYGMAQLKSGVQQPQTVDIEAIRREERESINRQLSGGAPTAHATSGGQAATPQVTDSWIQNEYDPRNPEHIKMMEEAGLR